VENNWFPRVGLDHCPNFASFAALRETFFLTQRPQRPQRKPVKIDFSLANENFPMTETVFREAMINIAQAESTIQIDEARLLFREYEAWLGLDLCFQNFEAEVAGLPGKYAPPDGRLLLATMENKVAGGIALRDICDGICEMKRLFVREQFRGLGIGVQLIERLIMDARGIGYQKMRLDTYPPKMGKAVNLYESHGFRPISRYYDNPHEGVLFMELML